VAKNTSVFANYIKKAGMNLTGGGLEEAHNKVAKNTK
jgi:hypothetical protein